MGVIDSQWWSMRWPAVLLWCATAVCCGVVLWYGAGRLVKAWRRRNRPGHAVSGRCFYLDEEEVKDVADLLHIPRSDVQVSEEVNAKRGAGVTGTLPGAGAKLEQSAGSSTKTERKDVNTPMKTISLIMDRLWEQDRVVDADLVKERIALTAALADELRDTAATDGVALTDVRGGTYLSVSGLFTVQRTDRDDFVLRARYGTGATAAQVKIVCEQPWVRRRFPVDTYSEDEKFPATCLGLVRSWNDRTQELTLDPVAIFQW
ncbi:hypothetical protein [Streptomyces lanatus]|uniref:Secreted protein n=1 Tax=Streptomyces lanatus TaxID=66900 RepID=A0ABV1Y0B8_9ACTN|nr:hypothetical protein [Streptomyces lanatus]GHH21816.1 hypothetical protein GCM10018780_69440 [Streptomyces lanatus]